MYIFKKLDNKRRGKEKFANNKKENQRNKKIPKKPTKNNRQK
jgi:hypothetical protein